jgi:hypothetical protein
MAISYPIVPYPGEVTWSRIHWEKSPFRAFTIFSLFFPRQFYIIYRELQYFPPC